MLFWIIFVLTIVVTVITVIAFHEGWESSALFGILSTLLWIASIIMIVIIANENACANSNFASLQQRQYSLEYQLHNNLYDNDNDIGKKELYNQIQEWNEDLAFKKRAQRDFWIGIFYANIYDNFNYIKLP